MGVWGDIGEQFRRALEKFGSLKESTFNTAYAQAKVVVKDYTQATSDVGSVASGAFEDVTINPPSGKLWRVLVLRITVKPDGDATSGNHTVSVLGQTLTPVIGNTNRIMLLLFG